MIAMPASARRARPRSGCTCTRGEGNRRPCRLQRENHDAVKKFHAEGLKAGGRDNGGAGPREDYSPTYYAAFLIDPDGNNVEAVCT